VHAKSTLDDGPERTRPTRAIGRRVRLEATIIYAVIGASRLQRGSCPTMMCQFCSAGTKGRALGVDRQIFAVESEHGCATGAVRSHAMLALGSNVGEGGCSCRSAR
jgi:hypothetical protein